MEPSWYVDDRGYIHGGFDTPIFLQALKTHNTRLTTQKRKLQKEKNDVSHDSRHLQGSCNYYDEEVGGHN